jgi:CubicO group peptidase (beta-lactamase class C family)
MTTVLRFVFTILLAALILSACSNQTPKPPAQEANNTPAVGEYLGKGKYSGTYWPTTEWRKCAPQAVGMNSEKLLRAVEYAATPSFNTDGVAIIRKGYIVAEAYYGDFNRNTKHISHSMAKSFTSCLVGIAIDKGLIENIDAKICQYYDEWDCDDKDDLRRGITLRHAMTLTTGLAWKEDWSKWDPNTNDALKMGASGHFVKYMAQRDGLFEPGQRFVYSTGDPMLLSKVIQKASGMTALEFARQNLFEPLNIRSVRWEKDLDGYTATAWGLHITVRDYAKFGYLFLNRGRWEDKQIVSLKWVEKATKTDASVKMWAGYGYLWHVNLPYRLKWSKSPLPLDTIPGDGYMAEGVMGQNLVIIPSKDLVIVRVANETAGHLDLVKFLTLVLDAIER